MDTVTTAPRRAELRAKLDTARAAMHRAASASVLKGDPLADQLHALADSIEALGEIYEASADTQIEIAETLRTQADVVVTDAIDQVHASGVAILQQLAPRLADLAQSIANERVRILRLKTILGGSAAVMVGAAVIAAFSYAAGYASGRTQGEAAAHTIFAAMAAGPRAATIWSMLMANNDPVQALAACQKSVAVAGDGRHYCSMPVWLDRKIMPD